MLKPVISHSDQLVSAKPTTSRQPRVDAADQPADDHHAEHRAGAARRHHEPGGHHRIIHQGLEERDDSARLA